MSTEALQRIRQKYPQYSDLPDQQLAALILAKYPQYRDLLGDIVVPIRQEAIVPRLSRMEAIGQEVQRSEAAFRQPVTGIRSEVGRVGALLGLGPRVIEAGLTAGGGYRRALARRGVPEAGSFGPAAALAFLGSAALDPSTYLTAGFGRLAGAARAVRPTALQPTRAPVSLRAPFVAGPPGAVEETVKRSYGTLRRIGLGPGKGIEQVGGVQNLSLRALPAPSGARPTKEVIIVGRFRPRNSSEAESVLVPPRPPEAGVQRPLGAFAEWRNQPAIVGRVFGEQYGRGIIQTANQTARNLGPRNVFVKDSGLLKLSAEEDSSLFQALEGRAAPLNEKVARIAQQVRQVFDDDAAFYTQAGARVRTHPIVRDPQTGVAVQRVGERPFQAIRNYAPRMLDPRRVMAIPREQLAQRVLFYNRSLSPQQAGDVADTLRATAMGQQIPEHVSDDIARLVTGHANVPAHLHARTGLTLPDEILRPMREAIPIYMEQAARERAFLEVFGANADEAVEQVISRQGMRNPDVRLAVEVWDTFRGRDIRRAVDVRLGQKSGILNNLATATLLGVQTAAAQLSQYGMIVARLPVKSIAQAAAQIAFRGGVRTAETAGAFVDDLTRGIVFEGPLMPTAGRLERAQQVSSQLARFTVRKSGVVAMDRLPRAVAYHAARNSLLDARRAAALGNRKATAALADVGLTPSSTIQQIDDAAVELAGQLNVRARPEDLPWVFQTSWGQFARGLNTFNVEVMKAVYRNVVQYAIKTRSPGPVMKFIGSGLVLGEVIGDLRKWISGRPDDRPGGSVDEFLSDLAAGRVPAKTVVQRTALNLAEAATIGFAQRIVDALAYATSATESGARIAGSLVGAGISSLAEVTAGLGQLATAPFRGEKGPAAARTGGRVLLRRVPLVGGPLAYRALPAESADRRIAIGQAIRAIKRGDHAAASRALEEFARKHGKRISQETLDRELTGAR